ncbi:MAG: hypothetical protein CM15mP74_14940 [Halieaceae bacterium]|nr:MAG: hypothetical protein CM15mP74_14940 [Halieaceae bacterium]
MGPGDFVVEAEVSLVSTVRNSSSFCSMAQRSAPHSHSLDGNSPTFSWAHRLQVVRVSETGAAQSQSTEHTVYVMRPR